jgi:hypothetical protein
LIVFLFAGTLHYSNGDVYEGSWVGDTRHGAGTFTSSTSGAIFVGSYCQGLRQGLGTLYMPTKGETLPMMQQQQQQRQKQQWQLHLQ